MQNPSDIHIWEVTRSSRHFLSANEWDASLRTIGARWSSAPPVLCESRPSVCIHYALNSSQFSKTAWIQARKFWLLLVPLPLPFSETHTIIFFSSVHQLKHAREKSDAPQRESERVSVSGTVLIYALICSFIFHFAHCATVSVVLNAQIPSDPMDVCWRMYICVLLIAENASLLPPIFRIRANLRFGCKSFLRFLFLRFVLWLSSLPIFCIISNWKISLRAISHSKRVYTKRNCPSPKSD